MTQKKPEYKHKRPNVVVILADDMGYGDLSCYGNHWITTSHLDSLATDGVRFTDGYSTAPLCSPSRAGLMTGRYQQRFGFELQVSSGAFPERKEVRLDDGSLGPIQGEKEYLRRGIPVTEQNMGEVFKRGGYKTSVIGKWHLGHGEAFLPQNRGFDQSVVFYGNTSIQHTDLDDPAIVSLKVDFHDELINTAWTREGLNEIHENGAVVEVDEYLMHYFRDKALDFIEENKTEPFFLYFSMNAPVPPLQVPRSYFDRLKTEIPNINQRGYNALLLAQDDVVGALLSKLKEHNLDENTIVVFVSDNGCAESRPGSNGIFSGGKFNTLEGGIRMPFIIKWPGHIQPGSIYEKPVSTLDILPTVANACSVSLNEDLPLDGRNLLPFLQKKNVGQPHDDLFWKIAHFAAVRSGDWKLYVDRNRKLEQLFNLKDDPEERVDQAEKLPEIFTELKEKLRVWENSLPEKAWSNYYGNALINKSKR